MIVSTSSRNAGASLLEQGKQELLSQLVENINSVVVMGTHSYTAFKMSFLQLEQIYINYKQLCGRGRGGPT